MDLISVMKHLPSQLKNSIWQRKEEKEKKKNFDDFVRKYPGLKQERIEDVSQFNDSPRASIDKSKEKMKEILRNPDM